MKLEDQVCSLELAKRLKELGCKQESLFWWRTLMRKLLTAPPPNRFGILTQEGWFVGESYGPHRFTEKQAKVLVPFYEERLKQPVTVEEIPPHLLHGGTVDTNLDIRGFRRALRKAKNIENETNS